MCMKCFGRIIGGETYISWPRSAARQVTNSKPTSHSLAVFVSWFPTMRCFFLQGMYYHIECREKPWPGPPPPMTVRHHRTQAYPRQSYRRLANKKSALGTPGGAEGH